VAALFTRLLDPLRGAVAAAEGIAFYTIFVGGGRQYIPAHRSGRLDRVVYRRRADVGAGGILPLAVISRQTSNLQDRAAKHILLGGWQGTFLYQRNALNIVESPDDGHRDLDAPLCN
jgi:hypothetical protein